MIQSQNAVFDHTETRFYVEKHEVVAEYRSNQNERRPVQPHEMEHTWGWHNSGCVWDKVAFEWSDKEDWSMKRCHTAEDKRDIIQHEALDAAQNNNR